MARLAYPVSNGAYTVQGGARQHSTGGATVHDDFESYADTTAMRNTWSDLNPSEFNLGTTGSVEGSQEADPNTTQARMSDPSLTTADGEEWSVDIVFDSGSDMSGFHMHAQDVSSEGAVLDDQVWARLDFANSEVDCLVAEGGSYESNQSAALSETLSTGTRYRLSCLPDAANTEATVSVRNLNSGTDIGSLTVTYDTAWSSGAFVLWAATAGTYLDYVRQV